MCQRVLRKQRVYLLGATGSNIAAELNQLTPQKEQQISDFQGMCYKYLFII